MCLNNSILYVTIIYEEILKTEKRIFMFRVIIVDDEMMIRTSISTFINNCDVGFEVVGTFRDGSDAIKYLE